jgi:putative endonuclease
MYYLLILYSVEMNLYYIGSTQNIKDKIKHLNKKKYQGADDWQLRYFEAHDSKANAQSRALELKHKSKRSYIEALCGTMYNLSILAWVKL